MSDHILIQTTHFRLHKKKRRFRSRKSSNQSKFNQKIEKLCLKLVKI